MIILLCGGNIVIVVVVFTHTKSSSNSCLAHLSTETEMSINTAEIIAALKSNRTSGGGRGKSSATSQMDFLGREGVQWIIDQTKSTDKGKTPGRGKVFVEDFLNVGAEYVRIDNMGWSLGNKAPSAKSFSKVTIEDLELVLTDESVVLLSEITEEQSRKVTGFGRAIIKNEQFEVKFPFGESSNVKEGTPKASDLAYYVTPWSILEEACSKFAVAQ
jgi:hypothetical protein